MAGLLGAVFPTLGSSASRPAAAKRLAQLVADTGAAQRMAAAAETEIRYRRTGLFISLAVIAVAMVALIFKVRAIER